MKPMRVDMVVPAASVPRLLDEWLDRGIAVDITIRKGTRKGRKVVVLGIYGSTQEDINAKIEALESLIN